MKSDIILESLELTLELIPSYECNLRCKYCAASINLYKGGTKTSLSQFERYAECLKKFHFSRVKISGGGEPTLHEGFHEICRDIKGLFSAEVYTLATNGCNLMDYLDDIVIFNSVELSNYPGANDNICTKIGKLNIPNINIVSKQVGRGLCDIYQRPNIDKVDVYERCRLSNIKQIVGGRIYPCPQIYWENLRKNYGKCEDFSVKVSSKCFDELKLISIESFCRNCWCEV
ncbi:MAG: radical SAM protein [Desulfobulbaceae bacterium]|nr:radical SAM protein [Desulfobulbaceae bacterium]